MFIYFFKYQTIVSRNGLSFGYSERDTSSVTPDSYHVPHNQFSGFLFTSVSCKLNCISRVSALTHDFFERSQSSFLDCRHLTFFSNIMTFFHLQNQQTDHYGARVRESVFRTLFSIFAREFESVETSPGFTRLL